MWTLVMVIAATASVIRSAPEWHYCYECSGQSALCRESVYDGQYLSKTACSSTCFLRYEGETIYRGCFDGWLGGMVHHEYQGCQVQEYLGEKVEWCFCKGYDEKPCNGESRDFINKLGALEIEETPKNNTSDARSANGVSATANVRNASADVNPGDVNQDKEIPQRLGAPQNFDYQGAGDTNDQLDNDDKTNIFQLSFEDDWTNTQLDDPRIVRFFEDSPKEDENFDCVTCHDSSPYCKDKVEQTTYLTLTKCSSKCFVRYQDSKIYRGCFDGWAGTSIKPDYEGCRVQNYMNTPVQWCFCGTGLCNKASIGELSGMTAAPVTSPPRLNHDDKQNVKSQQGEVVHNPLSGYQGTDEAFQTRATVVGMCRGHQDGVYEDPYDCTRFVHCFNGFTYRRLCPPGTIWNRKRRNCDYPHSSNNPCSSLSWNSY